MEPVPPEQQWAARQDRYVQGLANLLKAKRDEVAAQWDADDRQEKINDGVLYTGEVEEVFDGPDRDHRAAHGMKRARQLLAKGDLETRRGDAVGAAATMRLAFESLMPDTTPAHTEYLKWGVEKGVISQALLDSV